MAPMANDDLEWMKWWKLLNSDIQERQDRCEDAAQWTRKCIHNLARKSYFDPRRLLCWLRLLCKTIRGHVPGGDERGKNIPTQDCRLLLSCYLFRCGASYATTTTATHLKCAVASDRMGLLCRRSLVWWFCELNKINLAFVIMWFASQTFHFVILRYSNLRNGRIGQVLPAMKGEITILLIANNEMM